MCARCAPIPGEGAAEPIVRRFPLTRIAQARSDLSPPGRGEKHSLNVIGKCSRNPRPAALAFLA